MKLLLKGGSSGGKKEGALLVYWECLPFKSEKKGNGRLSSLDAERKRKEQIEGEKVGWRPPGRYGGLFPMALKKEGGRERNLSPKRREKSKVAAICRY